MEKTSPITRFQGDTRWLSNFHIYPNGKSLEHYYQAAKAVNPEDKLAVLKCLTPADAKRMGNKIKLRPNWDCIKQEVMLKLLKGKFNKYPDLKDKLINTGNADLIEGNTWHDNTWGICTCLNCLKMLNDIHFQRENLLGKMLMYIRSNLIAETSSITTYSSFFAIRGNIVSSYYDCQSENWDGYGAYPVSKSNMTKTLNILSKLTEILNDNTQYLDVSPVPSGDYMFEYRKHNKIIFTFSHRDGESPYYILAYTYNNKLRAIKCSIRTEQKLFDLIKKLA